MAEARKETCRICGKQDVCHLGPGGEFHFLPRDWERWEDKTKDRSSAMAAVCSERCKTELKKRNRESTAQRMGGY
jgi:hypothetical protein